MRRQCMTGSLTTRVVRGLIVAAAIPVLLLAAPGMALAHDEAVATVPAAGAGVPTPPAAVELELSAPPQELGTEVTVTGPDGAVVSDGEPAILGTTVTQSLTGPLPAGAYTVDYRVTSGDGHPITGSFGFTVAAAPAAPSTSPAPTSAAAAESPAEPSTEVDPEEASSTAPAGSSSTVLLVGGALVVLVAAGLVVRRLRRQA